MDMLPYIGIVILPVLLSIREVPARIRALRIGCKGFMYSPIAFIVGISVLAISGYVAEKLPFLKWGILGYNIIALPLLGGAAEAGTQSQIVQIPLFALFPVSILAMIVFNFWEEKCFRDSYKLVAVWTFIHLIMGTALYALPSIFCQGLVFKHVYDRYSVNHSYATHLGTNLMLVSLAMRV